MSFYGLLRMGFTSLECFRIEMDLSKGVATIRKLQINFWIYDHWLMD